MASSPSTTTGPSSNIPQSTPPEKATSTNKSKSSGHCTNLRVHPYPCDDKLPPLSKLSLARDKCTNKHCQCNTAKSTSKETDQQRMNYARVCLSSTTNRPRNYIQEAHLKLHHKNKDTRQLIRAARLQLIKSRSDAATMSGSLTTLHETSSDLFGQGMAKEVKDFASLVAEHMSRNGKQEQEVSKKDEAIGGVEIKSRPPEAVSRSRNEAPALTFKGASFGGYRAPPASEALFARTSSSPQKEVSADGINLRELEEGLLEVSNGTDLNLSSNSLGGQGVPSDSHCPLHPGQCKRPCTCSDQARLSVDDLSVDELAGYFDDFVYIPRKMSKMAEMMYT